ncbi:MAG: gamma-glutamyltransferase family protein [Mesorhizobium sp.]|nr:MAG: gamma-glutamyltransferase family protein [Mesorhizobium sp.]
MEREGRMSLQPMITGSRYMISTGQYLATQAGHAILEEGGNAIDAGVAAGIALGVVHADQVQFSGVAPMLIYLAERNEVVSIAGLGWWPKAATLDMFVHGYGGEIPLGLARTVIPAAPDAWILALERYGTMSFSQVAKAAIRYARDGFAMHACMAAFIDQFEDSYRLFPSTADLFLPGGEPIKTGQLFVQADLANSLQYMADQEAAAKGDRASGLKAARDAFYKGDLAHAMTKYHRENGGLLTLEDLASYSSEIEHPLTVKFGDIDVYSCQPWCQGPSLLQMLAMLDGSNLRTLPHNSTEYIHLVAETMNLAFADREAYFGDPRFVDVPMDVLLSQSYLDTRRALLDPDRAFGKMPPAGNIAGFRRHHDHVNKAATPPNPGALIGDTSYVCVVDAKGNAFSATPSDVSWEGPIIPGLGFCPSLRGSQSWAVEGHPSAIAPGKRPRLTPNPSLAMRPGEFIMPFGAPGGDMQPQGMLQVFLNHFVFGMSIQDAIDAPRFVTHSHPNSFEPHGYAPGRLLLERSIGEDRAKALSAKGHDVQWLPDISLGTAGVCAVVADRKTGILYGGADPRRSARAMGW